MAKSSRLLPVFTPAMLEFQASVAMTIFLFFYMGGGGICIEVFLLEE